MTAPVATGRASSRPLGRHISVVEVSGPLTMGAIAELEVELRSCMAAGRDEFAMDFTRVQSISSTSAYVLAQLAFELAGSCDVVIAVGAGQSRDALEDGGIPMHWPLLPTLEASLGEILRRPVVSEPS